MKISPHATRAAVLTLAALSLRRVAANLLDLALEDIAKVRPPASRKARKP